MDWILSVLLLAIAVPITAWMAGAIYYDVCGGAKWGRWVAAGWVGRRRRAVRGSGSRSGSRSPFCSASLALFLGWWLRLKPSHDRDWDPSVAVLPRAVRDGDVVTIENVRNFEYRSLDDFTPRYETRTYHLANLKGVDIIFFNWGIAADEPPRAGLRLRARRPRLHVDRGAVPARGNGSRSLRSLYRQQELIFLVADERDAILRRTKHGRPQEAHLYRFNATPEELRTAFLDYVATINSLYETPRWYHGLSANCTTSFYRLPNSRCRLDWRVLANGRLDRALYEDGRLDRTLPFPELRRIAYLNDIANSAPEAGFGDHIRRELERRRHER